jgi:Family of unknown function (DUF5946)
MTNICPECGAQLPGDATCQGIFENFLALEFTDPAYGAVHFLTVSCFMIQHGRYSDEGLAWIKGVLRAALEEGLSPEQIRRMAARDTGNQKRTWKVMRQEGVPPLPRINWSLTIADVDANYQDATGYCAWIEKWARATLEQLKI